MVIWGAKPREWDLKLCMYCIHDYAQVLFNIIISYKTDEIVLGKRNLQFPGVGEGGLVISPVTSTVEVSLNDMHCITSCFTLLTLVGAVFKALLLTKI